MPSAGLSSDPAEYRSRLAVQDDEQLDAWMIELMRDLSIRRGVLTVLERYRQVTGLDDGGIERAFTAGGGAPAIIGRTADGQLMVPAISLHHLVPGLRVAVGRRARPDRSTSSWPASTTSSTSDDEPVQPVDAAVPRTRAASAHRRGRRRWRSRA